MVELLVYGQGEERLRAQLTGEPFCVGRSQECDLLIPDPAVSRKQFLIEKTNDAWTLKDLSGRGTTVDNATTSQAILCDGMMIHLSQWRAIFQNGSDNDIDVSVTTDVELTRSTDAKKHKFGEEESNFPVQLHIFCRGEDERIEPFEKEAIIGNGNRNNTIQIKDHYISRRHLKIVRRGPVFDITDLNSSNGVIIGGALVQKATVPLGCVVQIGETELMLRRVQPLDCAYEGLVGKSQAMRRVYDTIERIAPSRSLVAIFGESGTGKELVARAIHRRSARYLGPFRAINCGAIPGHMVEDELFGHVKGAFTGADKPRQGAFLASNGGTLFLDEIGELPLSVQVKLLRVIDLGEINQVGSDRTVRVDVRIIAATNRDLRDEIKQGTFREDLYWRINSIPITLPPLRARKDDIPALIDHFLKSSSPTNRQYCVSPEAHLKLMVHDWPGNVRELKNTLNKVQLLSNDCYIEPDDIVFDEIEQRPSKNANKPRERLPRCQVDDINDRDLNNIKLQGKSLDQIRDEAVKKAFLRLGDTLLVSEELHIARSTVYAALRRAGVETA